MERITQEQAEALVKRSGDPPQAAPLSPKWLDCFAVVMARLSETFRAELTPVAVLGYQQGLADLKPEELELACQTALAKHREFMPTPAQLREYLAAARAEMPAVRAADCGKCGGSGWYMPAGRDTARRCKHEAI